MSLGVHNNLAMMNASRQYKVNTGSKTKSAEKLSSGYRINRAADDAAGLQISEKMRQQIRGLKRGTDNAQDGVSWVQTGDGALEEVHALLQRMRELTVQSLNDTNTSQDRAALQAEFDELQCEVDRITGTTEFNTQNIFDEHESPYYQCEGNVVWDQSWPHVVSAGANELIVNYRTKEADAPKTATITVPAGIYTTQELMDEIDDAVIAQGLDQEGIVLEYTQDGTCNLNLEGGEIIDSIAGGLSYLFYEMYEGGGFGALIGTTVFRDEYVELEVSGENNTLSFDIEDFNGNVTNVSITIPNGDYTRSEIIDYLNSQLSSTDVTATAYGTGIKLEGANSIVTGFKGNMFKIDGTAQVYHSVFYDNVKYGNIKMTQASFIGGQVKPTSADQEEHQKYVIDSTNKELTFQANGATTPITITIPEGSYTVSEMVDKLNELFQTNNLELDASIYPTGTSTYQGIRIDSTVKGNHSVVGLDSSSSAYNTLFVKREYNYYGTAATVSRETIADRNAKVTGAKEFTSAYVPLTITAGQNEQFTLNVDGTGYTITLDEGDYNSAADIANQINAKLSDASAPIGYKDKVTASVTGSQVILSSVDGSGITNLSVSAVGTNTGYEDIFVKTTISYDSSKVTGSGSSTTKPTVTLKNQVPDPATFDSTNNTLDVTFNGKETTVTLPAGTLTHDQIIAEIEKAFPETTTTSNITFQDVNATGTSSTKTITMSGTGSTNPNSKTYSNTGSSTPDAEGNVGTFITNTPAQITIDKVLPSSIEVTDGNNQLQLTIKTKDGEQTKVLSLESKTYTPANLVKEIQSKIDTAFGTGYGGAKVSLDSGGKLVITADLTGAGGVQKDGADTSISCSTYSSTFLKELHTTETAATAKSNYNLLSNINITDDTNTFVFTYKENGVSQTATLILDNGSYTGSTLANEINEKLKDGGHNVTASYSSGKLVLKTIDTGSDTSISYSSKTGGTSAEALFGELTTEGPATRIADQTIQDSIVIEAGTSDVFNVVVNKTPYSLTLKEGAYDRTQFVNMLNDVFTANNVGLTAELKNNKIQYTTDETGTDASFQVAYSGGGSSMQAIYGQATAVTPGIEASFTQEGYLVLTGTQNGGSISVTPATGSAFLEPTQNVSTKAPTASTGYTSTKHAYIDGVNVSEPITIDRYNNELKFNYHANGATTAVSITVPDGDYYFSNANGNTSIVDYLQAELDTAVGANQLMVSASGSGIRIEAVNPGSKYYMDSFSGDFYKKVLCSCQDRMVSYTPTVTNGTQTNDLAYTVGRKDVKNVTTNIKSGINDTLSLDFTYGGTVQNLSITLDAGSYSGDALIKEIQEKLDEQLVNAGLEAGTIEAQIGGVSTGVSGSNDQNALVFKLSSAVRLPADGEYIIDGVSGNAAFSIFYQTEGELIPAYVKGGNDISEGVTILPGETDLSFKVDGTQYTLSFAEGDYTSDEIIDEINAQLQAGNIPLAAEMEDGMLKLSYNKIGKHTISDIDGLAKDELFFSENGDTEPHQDINIQLSSNVGDSLIIERPIVNTAFLKINSVVITQPKYANKALVRLDGAIERVSEVRSMFGSEQNRLAHAIANNENMHENTQSAESGIRDTDMAEEMVAHSRSVILEQAAMAMQAQAKNMTNGILQLLQ